MGYDKRYVPKAIPVDVPVPAPEPEAPTEEEDSGERWSYEKCIAEWLKELKRFRGYLDTMTLAEAIAKIEDETDNDEWWGCGILEGEQDHYSDVFDKYLGADTGWDCMAEDNKWIWKEFFDDLIKHIEHPGKPDNTVDPKDINKLEKGLHDVEEAVKKLEPVPYSLPTGEPTPESWPLELPLRPQVPSVPEEGEPTSPWAKIQAMQEYLRTERTYSIQVLFNIGWCLEMLRVCLNELKAAKAPGTQTDNYKKNLDGLSEGTIRLEQDGVFHD